MSQVSTFAPTVLPGSGPIFTETGNSGGPVGPDGVGNINVIGNGTTITVVGNPGTNTLTISTVGTGVISTLTGNSGGAVSPTAGNINVISATTEGTARIVGNPGTSTLTVGFTDVDQNVIVGTTGFTASHTVGVAVANTGLGFDVFNVLTTGDDNTSVGQNSMRLATTGRANTVLGVSTLNVTTGSNNIAIGAAAGGSYVLAESSNIVIGNTGTVGDTHTTRIGTTGGGTGQQSKAFIGGVDGVNVGSTAKVVSMGTGATADQLGTTVITAGTGIVVTPGANTITLSVNGSVVGETITGNSGGALSPTAGNWNIVTANSTAKFVGAGSTLTLDFSLTNLILGNNGSTITIGTANDGFGLGVLQNLTSGTSNTAMGNASLQNVTIGSQTTAYGASSGTAINTGGNNTLIGFQSGLLLQSGNSNVALGYQSGSAWGAAVSNNIAIGTVAAVADSARIRIGTNGVHTTAFIAGIDTVNVGSVAKVVTMASDQLGTATITAGAGIVVTPGANTITISSIGSGLTWSVITANQTAAVENGYFCNKAGTLALALPAASAVGDVIRVSNINTATGVQFTQAAGQQIFIGNTSTTLGAAGTLTSSAVGDALEIVCSTANLTWQTISSMGNWTPA